MSENIAVAHYDSFDREWTYPIKKFKTVEEAIPFCVKKNQSTIGGFNPYAPFSDHYGILKYNEDWSRGHEVWCPYDHKDLFAKIEIIHRSRGETQ